MSTAFTAQATRPRHGEAALEAHRFLLRIGLSVGHVFAWIFVFQYFYGMSGDISRALSAVFLMYALSQFVTLVLTPLSAMHLRRGARHSLVWGVVLAAAAFVWLGAVFAGTWNAEQAIWGVAVFAILFGAYRALYFVPFELARTHALPERFRMNVLYEIFIALMPLFAGLTLLSAPYASARLLFGAAALATLSAFAAFRIADVPERFSWSYAYTFKQLLRHKHRPLVLSALFDGIQGAALFLIWPLAIFLIVEWSYLLLGLMLSITLLSILVLRGVYRRWLASYEIQESSNLHMVLAISGWVVRLAAGTPLAIIVADSYSYATTPPRGTSVDPFVFEQSTDRGAFVDEYTALKDMALALGRIALCAALGVLVLAIPLSVAFGVALLLAAISSGAAIYLARRAQAQAY